MKEHASWPHVIDGVDVVEYEYRCQGAERKEDRSATGAAANQISCVACPEGEYPGPGWECKQCADFAKSYQEDPSSGKWTCQCKDPPYITAGDGCVAKEDEKALEGVIQGGDLSRAKAMRFRSVVDEDGQFKSRYNDWKPQEVNSEVLNQHFTLSAIGCWKYGNPEMCQALANLCVLTLYDLTSIPCDFLLGQQITEAMGDQGAPWIMYKQTAEKLLVPLEGLGYDVAASFGADPNEPDKKRLLAFQLAQYAINGTFLGFTELKAQLSICPMSYENVLETRSFGAITVNECEFYLEDLQTTDPAGLPDEANILYELYLEDDNKKLIDIPVLIRNYMLNKDNPAPNRETDKSKWKMARRFMVIDTASGVPA